MAISKELKLKKNETGAILTAKDGKAVIYARSSHYYREVCTDFDADFGGNAYEVLPSFWKDALQRMDFVGVKKLGTTIDEYNNRCICMNDGGENDCFNAIKYGIDLPSAERYDTTAPTILRADFLKKIKASRSFVSTDCKRGLMQVYHFTDDGKCVATDGRRLSVVTADSAFGKWLCNWTPSADVENKGNIFAEVFDNFDGKNDIYVFISEKTDFLKLTDGKITIYAGYGTDNRFPTWQRTIPDVSKDYKSGTIQNLKKFTDKKLLKVMKGYNNRVIIDNSVAHTVDNIELCNVGDVLNDYHIKADYLGSVAELFGDSVACQYNTADHLKCVVFGNLNADFALIMPMRKN